MNGIIKSDINPAGLLSRECTVDNLIMSELLNPSKVPSLFSNSKDTWSFPVVETSVTEDDTEVKTNVLSTKVEYPMSVLIGSTSNRYMLKKHVKYQAQLNRQLMSDLPLVRVTSDLPAFTHVGVDNFGPFLVVHGRKCEKC